MKDKDIKEFIDEIESKRQGLEQVLIYCINKYENETGMVIEEIKFKESGEIVIFDRLN